MAVKKKVQKIRQNKLSTRLLSASEIKSEPIEVIEIFDDWNIATNLSLFEFVFWKYVNNY